MTDQQVIDQLRRMKMFGNIDKMEADEYIRVLKCLNYTDLSWAVDWLIKNHEYKTFPIPNEIYRHAKENSAKRSQEEHSNINHGQCGSERSYHIFMAALGATMRCGREDFTRLKGKLLDVNRRCGDDPAREEEFCNAALEIIEEAKSIAGVTNKRKMPKAIMGDGRGNRADAPPKPAPVTQDVQAEPVSDIDKDGLPF